MTDKKVLDALAELAATTKAELTQLSTAMAEMGMDIKMIKLAVENTQTADAEIRYNDLKKQLNDVMIRLDLTRQYANIDQEKTGDITKTEKKEPSHLGNIQVYFKYLMVNDKKRVFEVIPEIDIANISAENETKLSKHKGQSDRDNALATIVWKLKGADPTIRGKFVAMKDTDRKEYNSQHAEML
jgi:hypothetical protein